MTLGILVSFQAAISMIFLQFAVHLVQGRLTLQPKSSNLFHNRSYETYRHGFQSVPSTTSLSPPDSHDASGKSRDVVRVMPDAESGAAHSKELSLDTLDEHAICGSRERAM